MVLQFYSGSVSSETEEGKSSDVEEEKDWADQGEKEEKDFPKAIERGRREVVATREWQELLAWREGWEYFPK